jgi:predicted nucleotidyltransferase
MKQEISKELIRLEQQHNIKILFAVESGSRAWGFESTDSDWDVRFIYIHNSDWYLSIDDRKDSIEEMRPNDIDLSGWELRKALKLFRKSNPPLLEWLSSPIIYSENYSTAERLRKLTQVYFSPKSCMHHYLNIATPNFKDYLQKDNVKVKKYFYALRPIMACMWIESNKTMPPMEFHKLMDAHVGNQALKQEINNLLERKRSGQELNLEPRIKLINDFLQEKIDYYSDLVKQYGTIEQANTDKLNELFRFTLNEVW